MGIEATPLSPQGQRTLAAIVFSDVVNFSARMNQDEEHTLVLIQRDLDLMSRLCQQAEGQVLKSTGDGLLMYFNSAVQAVLCAQNIQKAIAAAAAQLPSTDVLLHRIGIHLGDVFVSESDVMGDGVNIAARLQAEAEPGGICLSQVVYDVVKRRLALKATYLGPRELKNIQEAVHVYQILLAVQASETEVEVDPTHLQASIGAIPVPQELFVPDELRSQLETLLVRAMGPMAAVILDRALSEAESPRDLAERLLRHIPTSMRDSFREEARQLLIADSAIATSPDAIAPTHPNTPNPTLHATMATSAPAPTSMVASERSLPFALNDAERANVQQIVVRAVGPMGHLLFQQALVAADSAETLINYIARSIPENVRESVRDRLVELHLGQTPHTEAVKLPTPTLDPTLSIPPNLLPVSNGRDPGSQVTPEFLERCQAELARIIGPMAGMVMRNVKSRNPQLTQERLVEAIATQIPNADQVEKWRSRMQA
ncbi:MAG: adenylate/guanylate cyclase domain-containing protein [Cyanobacteria bacterium J06639_1]